MREPQQQYEQHDEIYRALGELTQVCRNLEAHSMERDKKVDEMVAKVEDMYKRTAHSIPFGERIVYLS